MFYCLGFVEDISANIVEKQVIEAINPDLKGEGGFSFYDDREFHWE